MARTFNGTTDTTNATATGVDTGAWTKGAWIYPTGAGEGSVGSIVYVGNPGTVSRLRIAAAGMTVQVLHDLTTDMSAISTTTIPTNAWTCIIGGMSSGLVGSIWLGDLDTAMTEVAYGTRITGVGTRDTGGTVYVGNNDAGSHTFAGRIAHAFLYAGALTEVQREMFRQGNMSFLADGNCRVYAPMNHTTASEMKTVMHPTTGAPLSFTVTGTTVSDDPPVSPFQPGPLRIIGGAAAPPAATSLIFNRRAMTRAQLVR